MADYKSKHTGAEIDAGIDKANAALPLSGGTMTGELILSGDPATPNAAAPKKYVDNAINNISLTPGEKGDDGVTFTPSVSTNGDLSWTNNGGLTNPGTVNVKGPKGDSVKGDDGVSPTISVLAIAGGHRISIADKDGTKAVDVMDGEDGSAGRGISTIARTAGNGAAGTTDTYTITYTDGTKTTFGVYNGKNGTDGVPVTHSWNGTILTVTSASGTSSANLKGEKGDDGVSPAVSVSRSGKVTTVAITDKSGTKTSNINDGADGKTPVKGTDYWTEDDKAEIVRQVLASLATPVAGIVDENNNIIVTANLPDGTYKMRYEYPDGTKSDIVTINISSGPAYTNLADPKSADWLTGKRINSSKNIVDVTSAQSGGKTCVVTNFIARAGVSKLHIKGLDIINPTTGTTNYGRVYAYTDSDTPFSVTYQPSIGHSSAGPIHYTVADYDSSVIILDLAAIISAGGSSWGSMTRFRLGGFLTGAAEDVIITADEPIV